MSIKARKAVLVGTLALLVMIGAVLVLSHTAIAATTLRDAMIGLH